MRLKNAYKERRMIRKKLCFNRSMVVLIGYSAFIGALLLVLNTLYPHKNIVPKELTCSLKTTCNAQQLAASYWFPATSCSSDCTQDALVRGDKNPGNVYESCFDGEKIRCIASAIDPLYPPYNAILQTPLLSTGTVEGARLSPCSLFGDMLPEKADHTFAYFDMKHKRVIDYSSCAKQTKTTQFACTAVNTETQTVDVRCYRTLRWGALSSHIFDYQFADGIRHADMMNCTDITTVLGSQLPFEQCTGNSELFCKTDTGVRCYSNPT
jgi:hypothetical protein